MSLKLFRWYYSLSRDGILLAYKKQLEDSIIVWYTLIIKPSGRHWAVNDFTKEELSFLHFRIMDFSPDRRMMLSLIKDIFLIGEGLNEF
jgi:hypothetical protein